MKTITLHAAASPEDLDHIRTLMRAYGAHLANHPAGAANICLEGYEREMETLPGLYAALLLAEVDAQPAGCVALKPVPGGIEMKRLWVGEAYRGLGLGRKLIEAGIAWAREAGYAAMLLDTVPAAMPEANSLYERLGFLPTTRYNDNPVAGLAYYRLALISAAPS